MRIRFSSLADRDLDAIKSYIAADDPGAADRTIARIFQSILYLTDYPHLGRPGLVENTRELSIRGLPFKAVYRTEGDIILILTILHTSRLYPD